MKYLLFLLLFANCAFVSVAQSSELDSMQKLIIKHSNDTSEVFTLLRISVYYSDSKPDTALKYAQNAIEVSRNIKFKLGEGQANNIIANIFLNTGNYVKALETQFNLLKIWESTNDTFDIAASYNSIALVYSEQQDYTKALLYYSKAERIFQALGYDSYVVTVLLNIGDNYEKMNELDSALLFGKKAYELAKRIQDIDNMGMILTNLGNVQYKLGKINTALNYYKSGAINALDNDDKLTLVDAQFGIAKTYKAKGLIDSAIVYARQSLDAAIESSASKGLDSASILLSGLFEAKNQTDSAFFYYKKAISVKNALFTAENVKKVQVMSTAEQLRQLVEAQKAYRDKTRTYILIGGLIAIMIVAFILFRSNRQKRSANKKIEQAYKKLKSTQAQLIQSEKMASLGEVTAGIAHEIQNPLNFVNNFSEVNADLLSEMKDHIDNGNMHEVKAIANDVIDNQQKISHHGKRADAIVKGMLQHSMQTKGVKESTNINTLCDEYLRLSYHGLRAKDKSFSADFKTDFDKEIGKINIVPQDIGRVFLNLFNNAFYTINEKLKAQSQKQDRIYKPLVIVSTKKVKPLHGLAASVEIIITDNGSGIPKNIIDKIFQPFFTTKPTGQGTGLGLSLAYDIITKEHGGTIKVESNEGIGSKFIINLPIDS